VRLESVKYFERWNCWYCALLVMSLARVARIGVAGREVPRRAWLPEQDDAKAGAAPAIATPATAHFNRRLFSAISRSPFVPRVPILENVFSKFNAFLSKWLVGSYAERRRVGACEPVDRQQA
jgi:hypothetical protein